MRDLAGEHPVTLMLQDRGWKLSDRDQGHWLSRQAPFPTRTRIQSLCPHTVMVPCSAGLWGEVHMPALPRPSLQWTRCSQGNTRSGFHWLQRKGFVTSSLGQHCRGSDSIWDQHLCLESGMSFFVSSCIGLYFLTQVLLLRYCEGYLPSKERKSRTQQKYLPENVARGQTESSMELDPWARFWNGWEIRMNSISLLILQIWSLDVHSIKALCLYSGTFCDGGGVPNLCCHVWQPLSYTRWLNTWNVTSVTEGMSF